MPDGSDRECRSAAYRDGYGRNPDRAPVACIRFAFSLGTCAAWTVLPRAQSHSTARCPGRPGAVRSTIASR